MSHADRLANEVRSLSRHSPYRINNSCGATRLGTETVPTQRVPTYAGLCLRSAFSVSHTRTVVLSVRPQESIQLYVTCRDLTARGSL